jgi:hypothetical protein
MSGEPPKEAGEPDREVNPAIGANEELLSLAEAFRQTGLPILTIEGRNWRFVGTIRERNYQKVGVNPGKLFS